MGIRTPDIQLAKLALYQLSYTPLLPARRGITRKEKDQVVRCVPLSRTRGNHSNNISFRCGMVAHPASLSRISLPASGFSAFQHFSFFFKGPRPFAGTVRTVMRILLRKEVIQPQVPLRLPCYDFVPITSLTLGRRLHCWLANALRAKPAFMT